MKNPRSTKFRFVRLFQIHTPCSSDNVTTLLLMCHVSFVLCPQTSVYRRKIWGLDLTASSHVNSSEGCSRRDAYNHLPHCGCPLSSYNSLRVTSDHRRYRRGQLLVDVVEVARAVNKVSPTATEYIQHRRHAAVEPKRRKEEK